MSSIKVSARCSQETSQKIHIRGMDSTAEKGEVKEAIEEMVGTMEDGTYTIGEFRPYGRNNQATTVTMEMSKASFLISKKSIRIGLINCQIEQHIEVKKCFKCWSYDHIEKECKGPDRSTLCHKCGGEGHKAKECQNMEKCPLCDEQGHKAGPSKCGIFRRALFNVRKNSKIDLTDTIHETRAVQITARNMDQDNGSSEQR